MTINPRHNKIINWLLVILSLCFLAAFLVTEYYTFVSSKQAAQCLDLRRTAGYAEEYYMLEHNGKPSVGLDELLAGKYLESMPQCPSGGVYVWVTTAAPRVLACSVHGWVKSVADAEFLFSSDFDSMKDMVPLMGHWEVSRGALVTAGDWNEQRLIFGDPGWADYEISIKAVLRQGNGYGIYYRSNGKRNISGYIFQYDPGLGNKFVVRKVLSGQEASPFQSAAIPDGFAIYDKPHVITITVSTERHKIKVDGVLVFDFMDASFSAGMAGIRAWSNTKAEFDGVTVKKL